jgi:hypothetical protein
MPGVSPTLAARSWRCSAPFAGHGEISVAAPNASARKTSHYCCGNHELLAARAHSIDGARMLKILIKFDPVKFDENSRHIRVYFAQKPRFIANDSFRPIC